MDKCAITCAFASGRGFAAKVWHRVLDLALGTFCSEGALPWFLTEITRIARMVPTTPARAGKFQSVP